MMDAWLLIGMSAAGALVGVAIGLALWLAYGRARAWDDNTARSLRMDDGTAADILGIDPPVPSRDPVEREIEAALIAAKITYRRDVAVETTHHQLDTVGKVTRIDPDGGMIGTTTLDFYLPGLGLFIECKRFYSPRAVIQLAGREDVVLVQGLPAARALAILIGSRPAD